MPEENNPTEVLSQSEVEALLNSVQDEGGEKVSLEGASPSSKSAASRSAKPFAFRTPSIFSPGELRRIRIKHEDFVSKLSALLTQLVKNEFSVKLINLETMPHRALIETMSGPTHLSLIRLEPLSGLGLVELSPPLGFNIISRLLGGKSQPSKEERSFTEIELSLVSEFLNNVLNEYVSMWRPYEPQMKAIFLENETSARFLKLAADHEMVFLITMEAKLNESRGSIRIALPHHTLEPLFKKLVQEIPIDSGKPLPSSSILSHLDPNVAQIPVRVKACWKGLELTLRDLSNLQPEDVLSLDPSLPNRTALYIGPLYKFLGQIGKKGDRLAVRITSKVT